jgi:hypothetical protein
MVDFAVIDCGSARIQGASTVCVRQRWPKNLNRPIGLLEMYFQAVAAMKVLAMMANSETAITLGMGKISSPTFYEKSAVEMDSLAVALREIDLERQAKKAEEIAAFMRSHHSYPGKEAFSKLATLIYHDLEGFVFEAIPVDKAEYYQKDRLFGEDVHAKFFSTAYDVKEAGTCLALGRDTASVFHLMRVLEVGLKATAKHFNISFDYSNWGNLIDKLDKTIKDLDSAPSRPATWREDREFFSQCASYLHFTKDGWRNYTAHAHGKYTPTEAKDMMNNVRAFMQKLSTKVQE